MNSTRIVIIYSVLSLMLVGSAVVLAKQVRHFMYEREDLVTPFRDGVIDEGDMQKDLQKKEADTQRDTLLTFSQTTVFLQLATPAPVPTPTPIPPPPPTPIIPAKGWLIDMVMKRYACLISPDKQTITVQVGQEITNNYGENFTILELKPDFDSPQVVVKEVKSGTVRAIVEQTPKSAGNPAPNPGGNK